MAQYKVEGADKRKNIYTSIIVIGGLVVATLVTLGILEVAQVEEFISTWAVAVGVLGGAAAIVSSALARKNVDPPVTGNATGPHFESQDEGGQVG